MNSDQKQSLPYPDTDGIMKNPAFINDIAAARQGELSDISDYIYFSLMLGGMMPDAARLFEKLAMTEMNHFRILGKMMISLGGDPAMRVRHTNPFYGKPDRLDRCTAEKIVSSSIERETAAVTRYRRLAHIMECDKAASALLWRLADDEEHHARMLSRLCCELG